MAAPETQPRDLHPDLVPERTHTPDEGEHSPGRWEREAEAAHHEAGPEDSATKSSRIYFFIILAIIIAGIAVFLILHPQGGD
jgi:hypothetical protein